VYEKAGNRKSTYIAATVFSGGVGARQIEGGTHHERPFGETDNQELGGNRVVN
jgi:hypothetical protein